MPSTAINPFMNPFNASCAFLFLFAYNIIGGWRFDVLCNTTEVMTFDVTCNHCVRSVNDNNNRVKIQILKAFSPYIYIVRTCSSDVVVIFSWVVQLSSLCSNDLTDVNSGFISVQITECYPFRYTNTQLRCNYFTL